MRIYFRLFCATAFVLFYIVLPSDVFASENTITSTAVKTSDTLIATAQSFSPKTAELITPILQTSDSIRKWSVLHIEKLHNLAKNTQDAREQEPPKSGLLAEGTQIAVKVLLTTVAYTSIVLIYIISHTILFYPAALFLLFSLLWRLYCRLTTPRF